MCNEHGHFCALVHPLTNAYRYEKATAINWLERCFDVANQSKLLSVRGRINAFYLNIYTYNIYN